MICQHGYIAFIDNGRAVIRVQPRTACQACAVGKGCGLGLFTGLFSRRGVAIEVPTKADWSLGDQMAVKVDPSELTRLASWAYGLPLLAFLLAAGLMAMILPPGPVADFGAGLAGLAALTGCALAVGRSTHPKPIIGRVVSAGERS